jgi:hypothetical protein
VSAAERRAIGDMKAGLTGAKPKLSIVPRALQTYAARPLEYGADKYARGNYHGPPPAALGENAAALRLLGYIDAAMRHLTRVSDAVNHALGTGGDVRAAVGTVDDDAAGGFPPSMLPDLAHALASVGLGITCAVDDGLLPADPGRPWDALRPPVELPQKADPAAERRRVDELFARAASMPVRAAGPRFVVMPADEVGDRPAEFCHKREWCDEYAARYNGGDIMWSPDVYPRRNDSTFAIVDTRPEEGS